MFGIPDKELKETLANADVTLKAVQQTLLEVQALVARATALLAAIERSGISMVLKAGNGS
jgi:hypothetical protein